MQSAINYKKAGIFEAPPAMVNKICIWAQQKLAGKVLHYIDYIIKNLGNKLSDNAKQKLESTKNSAKQYAPYPWIPHKASTKIQIDLTGWKYIKNEQDLQYITELLGTNKLNEILVEFDFHKSPSFSGWWEEGANKLVLFADIPSISENVDLFNIKIKSVCRTVRHELQHLGQDLMKLLVLQERGPGEPSFKHTKQKEKEFPMDMVEPGRISHTLRDEEFYTNLADQVEYVKYILNITPKQFRKELLLYHIIPNYIPKFGETTREEKSMLNARLAYLKHYTFFKDLKEFLPQRYRKAVLELLKKITNEIEI